MEAKDWEMFVKSTFGDLQQENAYGYLMFFVGTERKVPFVSIAVSDNEFDSVSKLDRENVFRINIGVSKPTFAKMFPDDGAEPLDPSTLDIFMPHPHYAKQHFICILNPSSQNIEVAKKLIKEAHGVAARRSAKN